MMKTSQDINEIFPQKGWEPGRILEFIKDLKEADARWDTGRMFGFVYHPGSKAAELLQQVSQLCLYENALCPSLFPSLIHCENEIIVTVAGLMHGSHEVTGNVTSGGTESIFLAMKAARDHSFSTRPGMKNPEIILPVSAHPAFRKAAHALGLGIVNLQLDGDYRADLSALPGLLTPRTILLVASAPSYPYGVIDPVSEMSEFAMSHGLLFHVDACIGGMFLPFMERCGYHVPPFDFMVKGVTSLSVDMHKYGYGLKGASVVLYRSSALRKAQFFVHSDWPGGLFGTPTFLGSRSGLPVMAAWALLKFHGIEGYLRLTRETMEAVEALEQGISGIKGLHIIGNPVMSVFSFGSKGKDIYRIGDSLQSRQWHLDRIMQPPALHLVVTQANIPVVPQFLSDLEEASESSRGISRQLDVLGKSVLGKLVNFLPPGILSKIGKKASASIKSGSKASRSATFYGIAANLGDGRQLDEIVQEYLDGIYRK